MNDLKWLQMDWDEGPDVGGEYGPYRQSERTAIYKKCAEELIEKGFAYRCFCTEEELEQQKQEAAKQGLHNVGYLGTWRDADPEEVRKRLARGDPYAIRFRVPPNKIIILRDIVRGLVTWNGDATLGDFVIMRSNGMPVYNFCVAVDDYLMNITHVIRAEEHLSNTPKQLLVLEALGCTTPPAYAHCSLILAPDRSKLSKRHGATSVTEFAAQGFSSNAMINYLCNLGWNSGLKQEIYTPEELIRLFDLSRIVPSAAVFDMRKLRWINAQHLYTLPPNEFAEKILAPLRDGKHPLLKYAVFPGQQHATHPLPRYEGTAAEEALFVQSLVDVLRKDLHLASESRALVEEYATYPLLSTITGNDTRPLEVVEDHYKAFLAIAKIVLRDYAAGALLTGLETDMASAWMTYVNKVAEELRSDPVLAKELVNNNIVLLGLRLVLTGRAKGPNVGFILGLLRHGEKFFHHAPTSWDILSQQTYSGFVSLGQRMELLKELVSRIETEIKH